MSKVLPVKKKSFQKLVLQVSLKILNLKIPRLNTFYIKILYFALVGDEYLIVIVTSPGATAQFLCLSGLLYIDALFSRLLNVHAVKVKTCRQAKDADGKFCLGQRCHHKFCLGNRCQRQPSANHICV